MNDATNNVNLFFKWRIHFKQRFFSSLTAKSFLKSDSDSLIHESFALKDYKAQQLEGL
jgi:hypothetical protein|tara:strand:- start:123 stop:296 length:174 start_codon:yes stop_codon:yes gene_type:complete